MRQVLKPGQPVEFVTPDEIARLIPRPSEETRIRMPQGMQLNAAGAGQIEVYKIPAGYEFEVRRVVVTLTGNVPSDPNTAPVLLNAAGKFVAYLRSGSLIEYAQPMYGASLQVPGVQTWGDEQGPYLQNAEVFEVAAAGLPANGQLNVYMEGILKLYDTRKPAGN